MAARYYVATITAVNELLNTVASIATDTIAFAADHSNAAALLRSHHKHHASRCCTTTAAAPATASRVQAEEPSPVIVLCLYDSRGDGAAGEYLIPVFWSRYNLLVSRNEEAVRLLALSNLPSHRGPSPHRNGDETRYQREYC